MDPITIGAMVTTATTAFNALQKAIAAGREIEDCVGQLGSWFSAVSDIYNADEEVKNPSIFKKIAHSKSVEQEALDMIIAKKKVQEQESQLREMIMYRFGQETLSEMYAMRREIKRKREEQVYKQRRAKRKFVEICVSVTAIVAVLTAMWWFFSLILSVKSDV